MSTSVETPTAAGQWWRVDDAELRTAMTDMQTMMRRNYHAMLDMIREADSRGLAGSSGYPNLPALLAGMLRIPRAQATQCAEQARLVVPAASVTGAETEPPLALTGQALAAGVIGADHVAAIATTIAALPDWVDAAVRQDVEATLVATAHSADARTIGKLGRMILDRLDQDGPEPREADLTRQPNELRTHTTRGGRMRFTGDIDAEAAALFTELLGPLAKPRPTNADGRDPRDTPERLGDAFVDILRLAAGNEDVPSQAVRNPPSLSLSRWRCWRKNSATRCWMVELSSVPRMPACWPVIVASCRWCWARIPSPWTSAAPNAPFPWVCAEHSSNEMADAPFRIVTVHRSGAIPITLKSGRPVDLLRYTISCSSVGSTTGCSTSASGK